MKLEIGDYLEKLKKIKPKKILLQLPEGLKSHAPRIASEIEKEGIEVIISGEPCYGGCDLRLDEAKLLDCDLILHFGHRDFGVKSEIPVLYIPVEINLELTKGLKKDLKKIKEERVAIYTSEPFRKVLDHLGSYLREINKEVVEERIILGCSEIEKKGEANIFVGSGKFHPLTLKGKTYFLDLERNKLEDITSLIEREERKRQARISKFKEAKKVGILVSKKPGQFYRDYVKLKQRLEREGKEAEILIFDEISNEKLMGFNFDFYLNTACPRIIDTISVPVIYIKEINYG